MAMFTEPAASARTQVSSNAETTHIDTSTQTSKKQPTNAKAGNYGVRPAINQQTSDMDPPARSGLCCLGCHLNSTEPKQSKKYVGPSTSIYSSPALTSGAGASPNACKLVIDPGGVAVAFSTTLDRETSIGRTPNLCIAWLRSLWCGCPGPWQWSTNV
jgi:hypothetical protein